MAEERAPSAKKVIDTLPDKESSENDLAKGDAQSLHKLSENLRRYKPPIPTKTDLLKERYRIEFSTPLPEFDSGMVMAYAVTDLMDPMKPHMALISQTPGRQRQRVVQALLNLNHPNMLRLVAAGMVTLSTDEERYIIVYERPVGKRLSTILAEKPGMRASSFLTERIIGPIASAIQHLAELDICHGVINADNIYFGDTVVLGPCAAEPCGFSQPFYYETLERMQAMPIGKGEATTAEDYYALAILVLYLLFGPQHFANFDTESLIRLILTEGEYNALTGLKDLPDIFYDFFRGMLSQNVSERWQYQQLKPWLEGKRYNVLLPAQPIKAIRPYDLGDMQANTRRELAHILARNWSHMQEPVQNGQVAHWVSVSLRNKELAESLARIGRSVAEMRGKNEILINEQLMRAILLLDPTGPIRINQLSFHISGVEALCTELFTARRQDELQLLAKFVELSMGNYWLELQRRSREYVVPTAVNNSLIKLDRMRPMMRIPGYGFGLERMLYELNPEMPCMSPMLAGLNVTTLSALLVSLDRIAATRAKDEDPIDRHIAAFLASRLAIMHEIRIPELASLPTLAAQRSVIALHLLSLAQLRHDNLRLPGLTHWLAMRIMPALHIIHSNTLRQKVKARLSEQAENGYTQEMAELIINNSYANNDQNGFMQALMTYRTNTQRIRQLRTDRYIDQQAYRIGFVMARAMAYLAFLVSLFGVMRG